MTVTGQVVLVKVEKIVFAIPAGIIQHIVRAVEVGSIPGAPEFITGVINYHGAIVPVIDFRRKVHLPAKRVQPSDFIIVFALKSRLTAILVDELIEYRELTEIAAMKSAEIMKGVQIIESVGFLDNYFVMLTDMERLLDPEEEIALDGILQLALQNTVNASL